MRRTHVTEQMIDPVIGRRIFTLCWFCAGLGVSILQMQLLAQAWSVSRQAITPACIVSAWVFGSLVGSRRRTTTGLWGGGLLACTLLWFLGTRLVSWHIGLEPITLLSDCALIISALLLGAISTAWLVQATTLARSFRACCPGTRISGDDSRSLYRVGASRLGRSHCTGLFDPTPGTRRSTCRTKPVARDRKCGRELGRQILES